MKVACTSVVAVPRFQAAKLAERSSADVVGAPLRVMSSSERNAGAQLRQDAVDHVTGDVGEAEVATLIAVGEPLVVDAE
jgi:hypothetical protein